MPYSASDTGITAIFPKFFQRPVEMITASHIEKFQLCFTVPEEVLPLLNMRKVDVRPDTDADKDLILRGELKDYPLAATK